MSLGFQTAFVSVLNEGILGKCSTTELYFKSLPVTSFSVFTWIECARCTCVHTTVYVGRPENGVRDSIFSFHHVHTMDETQVARFGGKYLYQPSLLMGPSKTILDL